MLDFSIKTLSDGKKELYVDEKLIASGTQEKILRIMRSMTQHERKMKAIVECYDELELFRDMLIDEFLRLCNYNDYNKLTLLKIGDVVDECFEKSIEIIKDMRKEEA